MDELVGGGDRIIGRSMYLYVLILEWLYKKLRISHRPAGSWQRYFMFQVERLNFPAEATCNIKRKVKKGLLYTITLPAPPDFILMEYRLHLFNV
jgi:hypothetical protein